MRILVVEARGLHIGFLGCYGNDWIATPNLDRLAAAGVVFDRHYHHCPDLSTSHLLPSLPPDQVLRQAEIADFGQAVLEHWRRSSAEIVFVQGPDLAPPWNLPDDLCDVYFDEEEEGEPWLAPLMEIATLTIDEQVELQNTYAAAVTWFDAQLGAIIDDLESAGELEQTLVCVTANAGLPLGEHGAIGQPRAWLHEECVHVPLLMRFPRQEHAGLRLAALTQPLDLLPTFQALLGQSIAATPGHDLLPLLRAETDAVRPYACSALQIGDSSEWALRTSQWALLLPTTVPEGDEPRDSQLYVKPADRWEVNDVRQQNQELAEGLEQTLRTQLEKI